MRITLPNITERRSVDRLLTRFFREHHSWDFRRAVSAISRFFHLPAPKVDWYEYIDWGKTAGRCFENGRILLVHPENWKKGRKYNSERQWVNTVYHEMGHYVLWADAERKADAFAYRWVHGVAAAGAGRSADALSTSRARRMRDVRRPRPLRHRSPVRSH